MTKRGLTLEERFWLKVTKLRDDDCWYWKAYCDDDGYGRIKDENGIMVGAHRVSYELHKGPIPEGEIVLHDCNHPPCVNPKHLKSGTYDDNMKYASKLGRLSVPHKNQAGERNYKSKLTDEQVREIKKMLADNVKQIDIAKTFGVSREIIVQIKIGNNWKHII